MERVETLANKLIEKIQAKESITSLLSTVKMLESELAHLQKITPKNNSESEIAALNISKNITEEALSFYNTNDDEKTVEVLIVNEEELQAELNEIKKNAGEKNALGLQNRPLNLFGIDEQIPTMVNRQEPTSTTSTNEIVKELNDILADKTISTKNETLAKNALEINDVVGNVEAKGINENKVLVEKILGIKDAQKLNIEDENVQDKVEFVDINKNLESGKEISINETILKPMNELSSKFEDSPIKDLKKAIGVNDRFLYLNELFRGDEAMYERSIKTINAFEIYPEAEFWIRRELKLKLGWDDKYQTVKQFDQLVRRRFA
ncbi:MAG: hypothetical protein ABL929_03045 [Ferruginibacter sp.]|nr:hypothetical protein [Ferruginibacter sp.]